MSTTQSRFPRPVFKKSPTSLDGPGRLARITDVYFHEDVDPQAPGATVAGGEGAYGYAGRSEVVKFAGTELAAWVDRVAGVIREQFPDEEDFRLQIDGVSWRCCRDTNSASTEISMRQIQAKIPRLSDLSTDNPGLLTLLQHPFLNEGGLVMVSGLTGSGKTTLCGAFIRTRLEKFAGRCVSVEDPPELPFEGYIGEGVVRQMAVDYRDSTAEHRRGFPGALRRAYRKFPATRPAILYVGEVRDEETAVEALKAASNGMLVVTTLHAESPITAIQRLAGMASVRLGHAADLMLSSALRLSIHSTLDWPSEKEAAAGRKPRLSLNAVFSNGDSHAVASHIRDRKYNQINQAIETQMGIVRRASQSGVPASVIYEQLGANK